MVRASDLIVAVKNGKAILKAQNKSGAIQLLKNVFLDDKVHVLASKMLLKLEQIW